MDRRGFLGVCLAGAVAGCNFTSGNDPDTFPRLGPITIVSDSGEPEQVEIRVRRDGEVLHHQEYEVPPADVTGSGRGRVEVEQTWPDEPGEYFVDGRLVGQDNWRTVDVPSVDRYAECITLQFRISGGSRVDWLTQNTCPSEDDQPSYEQSEAL